MVANDAILLGNKRGAPRARRWGRRLLVGGGIALIALLIAYLFFLRLTRIEPPPIDPAVRAAAELPVEVRGPRAYVGPNWMSRERAVWELHLTGDPYAMGWAHSRLGERIRMEQEEYMFGELHKFVPSRIARFLISAGVRLRYRHIPDFIPRERH